MKTRILSGTLISIVAGMFSRLTQHALISHPRPLHDPLLALQLHHSVYKGDFNSWDSFPSDHAAAWFGLAMVVSIARPKLGVFTMALAVITLFSRNYLGYHYPTNLIRGAAFGSLFVWLIQLDVFQCLARSVVLWSERHAPLFYGIAFFISYQIATLCAAAVRLPKASSTFFKVFRSEPIVAPLPHVRFIYRPGRTVFHQRPTRYGQDHAATRAGGLRHSRTREVPGRDY